MRLGLLRCDEVGGDRESRFGGYLKLFADLFAKVDTGVDITDYDVAGGVLPADPGEQDGWLISGARASVVDDEPWITDLLGVVRELDWTGSPTVGVCFGHQLLALALGGEVRQADNGWGIGVRRAEFTGPGPWSTPLGGGFAIVYSHMDQVTALPDRGRLVATTGHCPVAAFRVDDHMLGIQGHPEFSIPFADDLYRSRAARFGDERLEEALQTLGNGTDRGEVAAWMLQILGG